MPRVRIIAAPRANVPGVWALGVSAKTGPVDPATNVPTIVPGKNGRFFASGGSEDIVVTDEQLKELQSEPNKSLLAVVVLDQSEQPPPEGEQMAQNQPGTTIPPGTSPTPTPAPAPAPTPTPTPPTPQGPSPATETTPSTRTSTPKR